VTEADIVSFATQTGDLHPLHVDAEWAAATPCGQRVAPGMLTLSYTLGLVRLDPERAIALKRISDVVFIRPVEIGDTLSVTGRVASVTPDGSGASTLALTLATANQRKQLVCRARVQIKWRDAPPLRESNGGPAG